MARAPSPTSEPRPQQLHASRAVLDRRWVELTSIVGATLELDRPRLRVMPDYQDEGVWVGLVGTACERINRNRGGATFVAPLCSLSSGLKAWISLWEVWEASGRPGSFTFRELSITVYFGLTNDPLKYQAFRAEWPGIRDWNGSGFSFQSPGAGHPHWQIDVLQTLREVRDQESFTAGSTNLVQDFIEETTESDLDALFCSIGLERMHFASAAPWWAVQSVSTRPHMNAPAEERGLTRWMSGCLSYLKQELRRCDVRP
jgi:hypothetical protein